MTFHGFCPQCGKEIPRDRFVTGFAVCACGWCDTTPVSRARKVSDRHVISTMIAASVLMVLFYAHLVNWGAYAMEIPLLKLQQVTGTLSTSGYLKVAEACTNLAKFDCAKDAYIGLYQSKNDVSAIAGLAHLDVRLGDSAGALAAYASYFRANGNDAEASLEYAKLLEGSGRLDDAFKYYEASIAGSTEILPVLATSGVVRIMMMHGQFEEARERIEAFQNSAGNAKGYLNTELAQIDQRLGTQAKAGKKSKSHSGKKVAVAN